LKLTSDSDPRDLHCGDLDALLNEHFGGKIVRKDLTKLAREAANVPIFVLEFLLGSYCASPDEETIVDGLKTVRRILAENFVRPKEAEKIKSLIREKGTYTVIDKTTVKLNDKRDVYEAHFFGLGIEGVELPPSTVTRYQKLLVGGMWTLLTLDYVFESDQQKSAFSVRSLKPIQMASIDMPELREGRKQFTSEQWHDVLLRSVGLDPSEFEKRVKWHLLARMIPFVEKNYNVCELGPRNTGKSYLYRETSPNCILVSGGQTTVANLFYNVSRRQIGLVGMWDVVAFDEVSGIHCRDHAGVKIMQDFMAAGSFSRGSETLNASAGLVFVGNLGDCDTIEKIRTLLKTSHLLARFPEAMIDVAFFDRFHAYLPGWEMPKLRPEFFTDAYGFIVDYLAEFFSKMRSVSFANAIDKYFQLGGALNQRDAIGVKRTVSGLLKLLYPNEDYNKEAVRECLTYALEGRRRIKEQLKRIGGSEFDAVEFSYVDSETGEEIFVSLREQEGDSTGPGGGSPTSSGSGGKAPHAMKPKDEWEAAIVEIGLRRNRVEKRLRDVLRDGIRMAAGKRCMEIVIAAVPSERRAGLMTHGYTAVWEELYFSDLRSILAKNWQQFEKYFSANKNEVLGWLDQVNKLRADAHAKSVGKDALAYTRVCFTQLERVLGL
jgi:ATP-dependent Lon protease